MVFNKLSEFVSYVATRFSTPKPSSISNKSHALPPIPGSFHGYTYSRLERKNSLKPSISLQDLSTFSQLDIEEGNHSTGAERTSTHETPPNILQKGNGKSSFSKERVPSKFLSRINNCNKLLDWNIFSFLRWGKMNKWVQVICILCFLLLFASICFAGQFLYSNWSKGPSRYYVVLDCGSTGTRVYVYQASVNNKKDDNLPILLKSLPENFQRKSGSNSGRAYNRIETEPGLDKLVYNVTGLSEALKPLIQWAEKQIPRQSHKTTSLFLYATAGVRRLPNSDSDWLLNNAWSILKSSPFLCKKEWVKIITGMEEAYYGWIALNYHKGILGSVPRKETFGALDLGGSSLQVTFEGKKGNYDETSLNVSIGPVTYQISAYSLSGYGLNDAFDKSVANLLKKLPQITNADGNVEIKHPCLHSGYKEQYMCSNCAAIHLEDGTSPNGEKKMRDGRKTGVTVQLIGVPKWEECSALAKVTVNMSEWSDHSREIDCKLQPCALTESFPRPVGQFYVMSGFYVVYRFFNLTPDNTLDDVLEKGREFCEKTWDVARKSVVPQPFIDQYCFRAPYVVLLLREGLHVPDSNVIVGSGSITWTLGVALFEAGKAFPFGGKFHSYDLVRQKINPFIVCAIVAGSLFFLLCVCSCAGNWWMPKFLRRSYLPLFRHNSATSVSVLNIPAPFRFQRWSHINKGDGKMPLSPTIASTQQTPFDTGPGFGGRGIQFSESSFYSSSNSVTHSYSSGSLGHMQFDNNTFGSFWNPNRSQMQLQSRRSQSREDLMSSITDSHLVKI